MVSVQRMFMILVGLLIICLGASGEAYVTDVGRVSHLEGKIFFQSSRAIDWSEAYLNSPVQEGDRIWNDINTFSELHLGSSILTRVASDTKVDINRMDRSGIVLKLWLGSAYIRVVEDLSREKPLLIKSPDCSINVLTRGLYRIDISSENITYVRIYEGVAEVELASDSLTLRQNEYLAVKSGDTVSAISRFSQADKDDFDRYNQGRDELLVKPQSSQHVHNSVAVGIYDLDYYGVWVHDPAYGYCWRPRVGTGWVPYRYGRWVWLHPWGWTWVSTEPWGWAPYHYGYWYYSARYGWMWKPGRYYAPAWVVWTSHSSSVGWVPVHPDDMAGHHWQANNNHYWQANIANPKNSSGGGKMNGTTYMPVEKFKHGDAIRNETDMVKVNPGTTSQWKPQPANTIQPIRKSSDSVPSRITGAQARPRTSDNQIKRDTDRPQKIKVPATNTAPVQRQKKIIQMQRKPINQTDKSQPNPQVPAQEKYTSSPKTSPTPPQYKPQPPSSKTEPSTQSSQKTTTTKKKTPPKKTTSKKSDDDKKKLDN
ncbi:DUF6600 domain-containing protein [candidate division CSSED10-310 bacterium]|uniref:DUF6600 domain-containing protein n=1 Tax=candidate division CSSED10-310 bacterium TaxID=2855610 RepID=A0ABV6Z291_UNCC1